MMINALNPVIGELFGIEIRWYAICILIGVVIAVIMAVREAKKLGVYSDYVFTGVCIILPLSIIGARIWYVLFNLDDFDSFGEVIGLNGGLAGLAIQGGVMAAILSMYFYSKKQNVSLYKTLDFVAPGFMIGQICGRWGNFFNQELYGPKVKNVELLYNLLPDFIMDNMKIGGVYYHPTFLYESLLNLVGLILILVLRRKMKKLRSGDLMGVYLIWYGCVRVFTEILRSFSGAGEILMIGPIPVSLSLSIIFIICGILFLVLKSFYGPKEYYLDILKNIEDNKINTLIFDLDGTLVDSHDLIMHSFIYVFDKYFKDYNLTDEELESFFGPTLVDTFSKFETKDITKEELISCYREFNISHHDEYVKAFDGALDTLKVLKKKGYNICVVSSKAKNLVCHGLEYLKLMPYVDFVIGSEDCKKHKPDPEGILMALERYSNVSNAVYVGDHPNDILAGKNANIKTCGVLYSSKRDQLIDANPDYLIKRLSDLFKVVIL